jgi:CheY-like chemotaxis protein
MSLDSRRGVPTVAIVDDEQDITTYLRIALEDAGYRVVATTDAAGALSLLDRSRPDLICLDLLMPGQTGISLYASLVKHEQLDRVPIVILSGLTNREELPALLQQAGGLPEPAGFVEKPVDIEDFLRLVERLLQSGEAP